jgi:regulator of RNase E activity RraA
MRVEFDNRTNVQRLAVEAVGPDDVLVIDARGELSAGSLGNILATRMQRRGAAGVVTDGALRDAQAFSAIELPCYSRGIHAAISGILHHPVDMNVPIGCAGVLVMPGDVVVGDADGVIAIPRAVAAEVAQAALEQEELEAFILGKIEAGSSILGVYPADATTRAEYEAERGRRS